MDPESTPPASGDETSESPQSAQPEEAGRYVPYSGGSAGWFENSGVLKSERRNNYQFHREMDRPEVRSKQFIRWGDSYDRRGHDRPRSELPIDLVTAAGRMPMVTWDINNRGLRLHFGESPNLSKGQQLQVELLDGAGGPALVSLDAEVIWVRSSGATRDVWDVGMFFPTIPPGISDALEQMLGG